MTGFFAITKEQVRLGIESSCLSLLICNSQQFLLSSPINTSGFKIALELLLKSPYTSAGKLSEQPYSFGLRQTGSSKLSSKVMLKYVGQLLTLYAWSWGIFFYLLLAAGAAVVVRIGHEVIAELKRRRNPGELLPGGGGRSGKVGLFGSRGAVQESKRFV